MEQEPQWNNAGEAFLKSFYESSNAQTVESKTQALINELGKQDFHDHAEFSPEERCLMYEHLLLQKKGLESESAY